MHKLKSEIYKKGYNIAQFARVAQIDRKTLYALFEGKTHKLRGDVITLISGALKVDYEKAEELCTND